VGSPHLVGAQPFWIGRVLGRDALVFPVLPRDAEDEPVGLALAVVEPGHGPLRGVASVGLGRDTLHIHIGVGCLAVHRPLAFSADGTVLAVGDQTGRVALWDGTPRHRAGILRNVFPAPDGDTSEAIEALAISPDKRTLAVGGDAGTLQLWDTATQQPLGGPLTTPGEAIDSLAFSPDGTTLYAGSAHVPLQRYVVAPERAVTEVCARAGPGLTRAQWHTYIPEAPYRQVCGAAASDG
jgi:WD40 repeat protein